MIDGDNTGLPRHTPNHILQDRIWRIARAAIPKDFNINVFEAYELSLLPDEYWQLLSSAGQDRGRISQRELEEYRMTSRPPSGILPSS